MELEVLIGQFGIAGVIIGGLVWDRVRVLKENDKLQEEVRSLYKANLATLQSVADGLTTLANRDTK